MLVYFSKAIRVGTKLTPARKLLFATGSFQHEYIVQEFIRTSPYRGYVYARWTCSKHGKDEAEHDEFIGIRDNVIGQHCKCGRRMNVHNEIDLILPELLLTGHPDFVLLFDKKFHIREFKTMDRKDVSFDDLTIALADHQMQVSLYYKMLSAMIKITLPDHSVSRNLVVDYVDRSNSKLWGGQPYKSLPFKPVNDSFLEPVKNRLLHVKHGIETRELPERICKSITSTRAKNCDFAVECFSRRFSKIPKVVNA